jgi:hypothetical protein
VKDNAEIVFNLVTMTHKGDTIAVKPRSYQPQADKPLHSFCSGRLRTYLNNGTENVLFSLDRVYRSDTDLWVLLFGIYAVEIDALLACN